MSILYKISQSIAKSVFLWTFGVTLFISFFILGDFWERWINKIWVDPVMSKFDGHEWWTVILYSMLILGYYVYIYKKSESINLTRIVCIGVGILLYLICFLSGKWDYTSIIEGYRYTAWSNLLIFLLGIGEFTLWIHWRCDMKRNNKNGDLPKLEIEKSREVPDAYGRLPLVETAYNIITTCFYEEGSFALAITGTWGSGKTTFMNNLKDKYKTNTVKLSIIDFEPWKNDTPDSIVRTFFTSLRNELQIYIPNMSSVFNDYIQMLLDEESAKPLKILSKSFQKIIGNQNPYETIRRKLRNTKHKIVVFVDDIDRLSPDEIKEVLRLIRNTANFPYIQFIVAYDKNYVYNALRNSGIGVPELYLEKFLNVEIALPKSEERIICQELKSRFSTTINNIWGIDTEDEKITQMIYYMPNNPSNSIIGCYLLPKVLHTIRDVIRFHNAFRMIAQVYKDQGIETEIEFQDLFYIELLRYKYNDLYSFLCNKPFALLELNNDKFGLKNDVKTCIENAAYGNEHVDIIYDILNYLFSLSDGVYSIHKLRSYDKYFMFRLDKKVMTIPEFMSLASKNEHEFSEAVQSLYENKYPLEFQNTIAALLNQIPQLQKDENGQLYSLVDYRMVYGILSKLCKIDIQALRTEVSVAIGSHLANLRCIDNLHFKALLNLYNFMDFTSGIYFDIDNFLLSILLRDNLKFKLYHEVGIEEQEIIHTFLLKTTNQRNMTSALSKFIQNIQKNNIAPEQLLIKLSNLSDIQVQYFKNCPDKLSDFGFHLFYNCQDHINLHTGQVYLRQEALDIMKNEILKCPDNYFKKFIRTGSSSNPEFNTVFPEPYCFSIFGGYENFEEFLKGCNSQSQYETRVKNYWELYKNNGYRPIEFERQGNVQEKIDNNFKKEIKQLRQLHYIKKEILQQGYVEKDIKEMFESNDLYISLRGEIYQMMCNMPHK